MDPFLQHQQISDIRYFDIVKHYLETIYTFLLSFFIHHIFYC